LRYAGKNLLENEIFGIFLKQKISVSMTKTEEIIKKRLC
jgi:hypothetical protein